jgi:hypothetical protein
MQGPYVDCSKPYKKTTVCAECGEKFKRGEAKQIVEVYDDPWAKKPRVIAVHSDNEDDHGSCLDKLTDTSWADFRYQVCDVCERMIISQCPSNGWRSYFKPYGDGEICVKCYQDQTIKDGHEASSFLLGKIPGDFFNREEIGANGWSKVPGGDRFINGTESSKRFCDLALKLINDGHKVLVDYGAMGIGGGEGYVTMYCK